MTAELERHIVDQAAYDHNVQHLQGVVLPRIAELADPVAGLRDKAADLADAHPDEPDARNLYRVHWHNSADRRSMVEVPEHLVLPESLTGVPAKIVIAFGQSLSDDQHPQGTGRLWLPVAKIIIRCVRHHPPSRGLAIDRQLLPRRSGNCDCARLPISGSLARRHESRALQLAGQMCGRPVRRKRNS